MVVPAKDSMQIAIATTFRIAAGSFITAWALFWGVGTTTNTIELLVAAGSFLLAAHGLSFDGWRWKTMNPYYASLLLPFIAGLALAVYEAVEQLAFV